MRTLFNLSQISEKEGAQTDSAAYLKKKMKNKLHKWEDGCLLGCSAV
jgi:hypothetical protein